MPNCLLVCSFFAQRDALYRNVCVTSYSPLSLLTASMCVRTEKAGEPICYSHIYMSQFLLAWT